jgi:hypothetical protein
MPGPVIGTNLLNGHVSSDEREPTGLGGWVVLCGDRCRSENQEGSGGNGQPRSPERCWSKQMHSFILSSSNHLTY